jgi:signal transduction histidine kinase
MKSIRTKLLFSYLIVLLVGVLVILVSVSFTARMAYNRHLMPSGMHMGQEMMAVPRGQIQFANFRAGVFEALGYAALAASVAAVIVSVFFSRRIIRPLQAMTQASRRIATGHYDERVLVDGEDELAQLAGSFNQMAGQLEQTESMRRRLIGDVAHELRTPLTTIKGSIEGLVDGILPPDEETYSLIFDETERLGRLVDDLQELSRVESGAYPLDKQPVEAAALAATAAKRLARAFDEKQVALTLSLPADLPPLLADEDRILQVLTNLLNNALQYTPAGESVTVSAQKNAEFVQFSVHDTGAGIAPENLDLIFSRFYRVDVSRSRQAGGGSGIGLTLAKHLVEAHGGSIWAESPGVGMGSTFYFTIPIF